MVSVTSAAAMKLLDVSLNNAGAIIASVIGEFTSTSSGSPDLTPTQEIACLRAGGTIDLYRILVSMPSTSSPIGSVSDEGNDEEEMTTITLKLVSRMKTRSTLRCLATLRPSGTKHDVLVVGSDSGRFSILDFEKCGVATFGKGGVESSVLPDILHCPTHGKSGVRRDSPGQYIACDPCGRAIMITSIEKRKLVYIVHRDTKGKVMLASPLEAHRPRTLVFDTVGLDNGYDNPIFGCLEVQYEDHEETVDGGVSVPVGKNGDGYTKQLAYYELDLGLNHVCRRWATTVSRTACCLASIPGGANGPGGVLVGGEDYVEYVHEGMSHLPTGGNRVEGKKASRMMCALPRREHHPPNKGMLITSMTVLKQKKNKFFALAQTELGDVYKITLSLHKGKGGNDSGRTTVLSVVTCLLDTLPVGNCLNISKLALLFIPSEFGDHFLYQFDAIDIEDDAVKCSSTTTLAAYLASDVVNENSFYSMSETVSSFAPTFRPTMLKNLHKVCVLDSLAPVTSVLVGELAGSEVSPQVYALCGRGPMSALRVLRHGLSVTELAVSELPGIPGAVFNVRDNDSARNKGRKCYDRYIVVSFADATLVLAVGISVEEMGRESGFLMTEPTLACSALGGGNGSGGGGIVQVYPGGVRHIQRGSVSQWHVPGIKKIECASVNEYQILVALVGGELIYFEVNPLSGNVTEVGTRDIGADVCSLDVGAVPYGKSRSLFVAVGCRDSTVRLLSLVPGEGMLEQKSSTALGTTKPHSVVLSNVYLRGGGCEISLTVGLDDGSAIKAFVDPITGAISTSPTRHFLGARPVAASRITFRGMQSTLLLSSRPWIADQHDMSPLSYAPLDHGCSFSNEAVKEGIIVTSGNTLRILSFGRGENGDDYTHGVGSREDEAFNFQSVTLRYTPRQMCLLSARITESSRKVILAIVESDVNDFGEEDKRALGFERTNMLSKVDSNKKTGGDNTMDMEMDDYSDEDESRKNKEEGYYEDESDDATRFTPIRGPVPAEQGCWGSCVRLVDPSNLCSTLDCVEMSRNEAALCCASVRFHSRGGESLLAVGTVTGMTMHPLNHKESHVILYRVVNGERLQLLHRTKVDDGPVLSLVHFQGRLLVGIGNVLRLYEMGKRQLLKKCELRGLPTMVKTLRAAGDRAFVGDMMQSVQFVRYDAISNRIFLVAKDPSLRPIACQELLDINTVAVGDKFGNVSILRLSGGSDIGAIDVTGTRALWDSSRDDSTPKLDTLCTYHVGEVVTSMTRASLVAGGSESLIYVTVTGRVGALVPLTTREDVNFFSLLEGHLQVEMMSPTGRDPQSYRSYYAPTRHILDGDLCDEYNRLPYDVKQKIAEQLDRSVREVLKKLLDTKNRLL